MTTNVQDAQAAWGSEIPEWVVILADRADRSSQRRAAQAIGYSASAVNAVLRRNYRADLAKIEAAVRGRFLGEDVECPVLGDLRRDRCVRHQGTKFSPTNPTRVRLLRACPTCPNNLGKGGNDDLG